MRRRPRRSKRRCKRPGGGSPTSWSRIITTTTPPASPSSRQHHKCRVVAPRSEAARIAQVDETVGEGDNVSVGSLEARVIETPGHTAGHISYFFPADKLAFVGDTLFSIGCGRVIEGNARDDVAVAAQAARPAGRHAVLLRPRIHRRQYPLRPDDRAEQPGACRARRRGGAALGPASRPFRRRSARRRRPIRSCAPTMRRSRGASGLPAARPGRCSRKSASARTGFDGCAALTAADVIRLLDLKPHPEGGHFRETFRDTRTIMAAAPHRPRSIFCWRAANARIGIASMRRRFGTGTPARRLA